MNIEIGPLASTPISPTASTPTPSPPVSQNIYKFDFSADVLLVAGFILWMIWDKTMRPTVAKKLEGIFTPIEEERRITAILAQIGVITNASRVLLAAFHNGVVDEYGYHLQKMSVTNYYISPTATDLKTPIRDVPIGRLMEELELLLAKKGEWMSVDLSNNAMNPACVNHMRDTNVEFMADRLITVGNFPVGVISLQYNPNEGRRPNLDKRIEGEISTLEILFEELCIIMRRRVVKPPMAQMFIRRLLGRSNG